MSHWSRLRGALIALAVVLVAGTVGYLVLGFSLVNAAYQAVITVSTVGFAEAEPLGPPGQVFTMVLIFFGVGTALYALGVLVETVIEGRLNEMLGRHRMEQGIASLRDHVIICGWGRVGRSIARDMQAAGRQLVVVEADGRLVADTEHPVVVGDATEDDVLRSAGIERASALVAAVDADADNSFVTLGARAMKPDLFIVARARSTESAEKLLRAGADRVVNPQNIGGSRMAAFVLRPHVAEFLDVVMHDHLLEFGLEEVIVDGGSPVAGRSLRECEFRERTGALVLAVRHSDGTFISNPDPDTELRTGQVVIAIGTQEELQSLVEYVGGDGTVVQHRL
jgi:voltage-gated potassium channel